MPFWGSIRWPPLSTRSNCIAKLLREF